MRTPDIRRYEMLVQLKEFGVAHADLFPDTSGGGKLFSAINAVVDELQSQIVAQAAATRAARTGTSTRNAARDRLRATLQTLTRTAKIAAKAQPGLEAAFRFPASRGNQRFVAAARAIVQAATPLRDQIVAHHMPPTVLDDVTAAIDAFEAATVSHVQAKEARSAARVDIDATIAKAIAIVEKLDVVVEKQSEGNPALLADWRAASHVSSVTIPYPTRKQSEPPPAPTPSATKAA